LAVLLAVAGVLLVASAILLLLRLLELPVVQLVFSVEDLAVAVAVAMGGKFWALVAVSWVVAALRVVVHLLVVMAIRLRISKTGANDAA